MQVELAHQTSLKEVENFDKNALKNVEVLEKNPLPDQDGKSHGLHWLKSVIEFNYRIQSKTLFHRCYFSIFTLSSLPLRF